MIYRLNGPDSENGKRLIFALFAKMGLFPLKATPFTEPGRGL
jgi:hypothetical protein